MPTTTPPRVRTRAQARQNRRVLPPDPARRSAPVQGLMLDGRRIDMQVGDRLLDAELDRTIEGPNQVIVTLWNGDRAVLKSGVFGQRIMSKVARIELDGLGFIAAGVSKTGEQLAVTFEDEVVAYLKQHGKGKPVRRSRGQVTRAHFCADLIRQAGVPVIVLDEAVVQPIQGQKKLRDQLRKARDSNNTTSTGSSNRSRHQGIPGTLTIKGAQATSEQRRNIGFALEEAAKLNAPRKAVLAMLCAGIGESAWRDVMNNNFVPVERWKKDPASNADTSGYGGVLQGAISVAPTPNWFRPMNSEKRTREQAKSFLQGGRGFHGYNDKGAIATVRHEPGLSLGQIADKVEGLYSPVHYGHDDEAKAWLLAGLGGDFTDPNGGTQVHAWIKAYHFERLKKESTWACCWRLLVEEVQWRLFVREGVVIIASDPALMRATPSVKISERSDAVEGFDFDWHRALKVGEMTGQAYVGRWQVDPGEPTEVDDLPQDSRDWLTIGVRESLLATKPLADITLRAPQKPKPEPSSQVATKTIDVADPTGAQTGLYAACQDIDRQNLPYIWGGGHAHAGTPDTGTPGPSSHDGTSDPNAVGYDCSGSVGAALARAGFGIKLGDPVPGSGWFATNWGKSGRGEHFTVWANSVHIFIELHFPGEPGKSFDTRRIGDSRSGPHLRTALGPTAGFTARHWPSDSRHIPSNLPQGGSSGPGSSHSHNQ